MTARPTKPARVVDSDRVVECVFGRADVSVSAALEGPPASVAAAVDVEGLAAHGWRIWCLFTDVSSSFFQLYPLTSLFYFSFL